MSKFATFAISIIVLCSRQFWYPVFVLKYVVPIFTAVPWLLVLLIQSIPIPRASFTHRHWLRKLVWGLTFRACTSNYIHAVWTPCQTVGCNYRKISNIRRTISPNLNVSRLVLQLSLRNPVKPGVKVENEDVVGAAPTGAAPTTSEWSTILVPTKVRVILETWRYSSLP